MPVTNKLRFTGPTSPTLSQVTVTCHRSAEDGLHPAEKITENGDQEKVVPRGVWLSGKGRILLMEEILHQLIGSLSHHLDGFIHPKSCRISSINSSFILFPLRIMGIKQILDYPYISKYLEYLIQIPRKFVGTPSSLEKIPQKYPRTQEVYTPLKLTESSPLKICTCWKVTMKFPFGTLLGLIFRG